MIPLPSNEKKIVLVCDDSKTIIQMLKKGLADRYHIITASSGYEALSFALLYHPDIILLDVMMYGMDGFETLKKLRRNDITKDIPVVFVSALDGEYREIGLRLGAAEWLQKPYDLSVVMGTIDKFTE